MFYDPDQLERSATDLDNLHLLDLPVRILFGALFAAGAGGMVLSLAFAGLPVRRPPPRKTRITVLEPEAGTSPASTSSLGRSFRVISSFETAQAYGGPLYYFKRGDVFTVAPSPVYVSHEDTYIFTLTFPRGGSIEVSNTSPEPGLISEYSDCLQPLD